jgi:hypothetical protein
LEITLLNKILSNLTAELDIQKNILKLLTLERTEIVKLRATELDKLRAEKEVLLLKISNNKDQRDKILSSIDRSPIEGKAWTLKSLFIEAPQDLLKEYQKVSSELKSTLISIQKMNKDNAGLLRQSLGLVSSTISILTAKPTIDNTNYQKDGKVSDDQENMKALGSVSSFNRAV